MSYTKVGWEHLGMTLWVRARNATVTGPGGRPTQEETAMAILLCLVNSSHAHTHTQAMSLVASNRWAKVSGGLWARCCCRRARLALFTPRPLLHCPPFVAPCLSSVLSPPSAGARVRHRQGGCG